MKVSVIIPTWNRGYIIEKTLKSVLAQTMADFEILVADDGSTDDTKEKVLAMGDGRIRWIPGKINSGKPAMPRNKALKEARGEWVAFLDSDDEWESTKLEKQLAVLEKSGLKACSTNAHRVLSGEGVVGDYLGYKSDTITFRNLVRCNTVITSSMMIKKSLLGEVGDFPEDDNLVVGEDYALWLRTATKTDIAYIAEPLVIYCDDVVNSVRATTEIDAIGQKRAALNNFYRWYIAEKILWPMRIIKRLFKRSKRS